MEYECLNLWVFFFLLKPIILLLIYERTNQYYKQILYNDQNKLYSMHIIFYNKTTATHLQCLIANYPCNIFLNTVLRSRIPLWKMIKFRSNQRGKLSISCIASLCKNDVCPCDWFIHVSAQVQRLFVLMPRSNEYAALVYAKKNLVLLILTPTFTC